MGEERRPRDEDAPRDGGARPRDGADADPEVARLRADCAQLLDANHRLRAAVLRHEELLAAAAEDLRAPVSAVRAYARRAATDPAVPAAQRRALSRQAERLDAVTRGLDALRVVESGRVQLGRGPTDLRALVARAADGVATAARARGVTLVRDIDDAAPEVPADADAIASLVALLLGAAVAASPRGGRVRIALEASGGGARIVVETARRGRRAGPTRLPALRLELAYAHAVAALHGGDLEVRPRQGGIVAALTLAPERAPASEVAAPSGRPRLVVADDDGDARELLEMMLGPDYDVLLAADGQEAVELAEAVRPDLVLMDLYMPRLDGLAALQALRAEPATAQVPVILLSGRGDELTRARSLDLGAVDFLQKPFSPRELKARIERTLRLTRRESQLAELARTDALTGLANVRAFRARLDDEVKRARRYRTPLACVMVDMDRLKPINDELGHPVGDVAIATVAEVIRRELRETDFGARYGGDEFVVLLPHTAASEARVFAERVCARLRETTLDAGGRRVPLAASFGLAALGDDALEEDAGDALVRRADAALYQAKRAGRGQVASDLDRAPAAAPTSTPA